MFKKALIAAVSTVALSAPSFAGSIGTLTGTTSTTITGGTSALTINGNYSSEEHSVSAGATASGSTGTASWTTGGGPSVSATSVGTNVGPTDAVAGYSTNAVAGATYLSDRQYAFTGTESGTSTGVFFNY